MQQKVFYKWLGLFVSLVLPTLRSVYILLAHPGQGMSLWVLQIMMWAPFLFLLLILRYGERESLNGLGSFTINLKIIGVAGLIIIGLFGATILFDIIWFYVFNLPVPDEPALNRILNSPLWLKIEICIWAGLTEEIFFRGYAITRLQQLTGSKIVAVVIPLLIFAVYHIVFGTLYHILFALAGGIVLTVFYLKFRNLLANMLGHSIFDFIAFVFLN